jgi:hypothetical protein
VKQTTLKLDSEQELSIWHRAWRENKTFSKVFVIAICLPVLGLLLFSMSAMFGVIATAIYFALMLLGFKLYDLWQEKQRRTWLWDWEESMRCDGWKQVAENRWEWKYWDYYENRYIVHKYFVDEPAPKYLSSPSRKTRKHISYIVKRKRPQK